MLLALIRFMKTPSVVAAEQMQNVIFYDGARVRAQLGERLTRSATIRSSERSSPA